MKAGGVETFTKLNITSRPNSESLLPTKRSLTDACQWSASRSGRLYPDARWIEGWVGRIVVLEVEVNIIPPPPTRTHTYVYLILFTHANLTVCRTQMFN
jgi:hypothetical protein